MKPRILLIYTGGTIGMMASPTTGELRPLDFEYIHQQIPEIERLDLEVIPISITNPIDSSHMTPSHWVELVELIEKNDQAFDGFVLLHGTDTMAYTASALSFMIQGLPKPIVLTGSQLPVGILRSDGKENILAALEIAGKKRTDGNAELQEVAVFFQSKLFRGTRVSKISAHQFDAFDSPNYPLLGVAGVDIKIHSNQLLKRNVTGITYGKALDQRVGLVKLYPGINLGAYQSVFDPNIHRAIIVEAYGSGNTPNHESFTRVLTNYVHQGGILLTISQCTSGSVQPGKYASGHLLAELGAWNGTDLTTEAAVTKLMWYLGTQTVPSPEEFSSVVAGESA
ncbi:MAG: asparaginase [Flavobacteriales bacterium]